MFLGKSFWMFCSTLVTGLSAVSPPGLILGADGEGSLMFAVLQVWGVSNPEAVPVSHDSLHPLPPVVHSIDIIRIECC